MANTVKILTLLHLVFKISWCLADDWIIMINEEIDELNKENEDNTSSDPCQPYNPTVPNFNAPGRRISETKCYEYIWNIKYRIEKEKRKKKCSGGFSNIFVVGGKKALPGEYPHMGAIGWKASVGAWVFKCGGTLISPKFVLTAAHCTRTTTTDTTVEEVVPRIVRFGTKNILDEDNVYEPPIDKNIINIITHPLYRPPKKYYDIALMELETKVMFNKVVQPACLWTNPDDHSLMPKAIISGWGVTNEDSQAISPNLRAAVINIVNRKTCNNIYRPFCNRLFCQLKDNQICAGMKEGGIDSCQGDSGGPLQVEISLPTVEQGKMYYVIGVTSFGRGCAREEMPGIYTKVASFLDWIENIIWY